MNTLDKLLGKLRKQYESINPQVVTINKELERIGETIVNDHIAFRTFDLPGVNIEALSRVFRDNGYQEKGSYHFDLKHLEAKHYEHENPTYPKIFISEIVLEKLSSFVQKTAKNLVSQIAPLDPLPWNFSASGRPWPPVSFTYYQTLLEESEYAAWLAAFGYRANHFTIFVNALKSFDSLSKLNSFIENLGFPLNESGGKIKGSPESGLEQSSTLAAVTDVDFADGRFSIPGCYYEFAQRYPRSDGTLFNGFIAKSADKLFESTDHR